LPPCPQLPLQNRKAAGNPVHVTADVTQKRIDFTVKKIFVTIALSVAALACAGEYSMEYSGKRTKLFRNGNAVDFLQCVTEQIKRYPDSEIDDFVKLAYQASWGPAHALADRSAAWKYFSREFSAVKPDDNIPLFEIISPDYCRINLGAWKQAGLPEKWLFNMFYASAEVLPDSHIIFNDYIRQLRTVLGERKNALDDFMKQYRGGAVHHSLRYREKYQPHYRLVNVRFLTALPVLVAAAKIPQKSITVIAVDGRAASGKTTLARQLAAVLETDAIHMDDFFLPLELRTPARLAEPGGNIHYERFKTEVLPFLKQSNSFSYQCFDCSKMQPGKMRNIPAARWRIVEGAYSLHPAFGSYADLKVFLDISKEEQIKRIRKRNGEQKAAIFAKRWIPMEEKYIKTFDIKAKADIIVGN
jgi:uridine kinase